MSTDVNEGNVRAPFSKHSLQVRHSDGTWAKGGIGNAFQAQTPRPLACFIQGYCSLLGSESIKWPEE